MAPQLVIIPIEALLDCAGGRESGPGGRLVQEADVVVALHPVHNREFELYCGAATPGRPLRILKVLLDAGRDRMPELRRYLQQAKGHGGLQHIPD